MTKIKFNLLFLTLWFSALAISVAISVAIINKRQYETKFLVGDCLSKTYNKGSAEEKTYILLITEIKEREYQATVHLMDDEKRIKWSSSYSKLVTNGYEKIDSKICKDQGLEEYGN